MKISLLAMLIATGAGMFAWVEPNYAEADKTMTNIAHLHDFSVIEFRHYTTTKGERDNFARYFESYFPEAFEQLGSIVFGQFADRNDPDGFLWLRGFTTIESRAVVSAAFYYGPLWKEHKVTMNDRLVDSDNVLLLRPIDAAHGVTVLPAVDPVNDLGTARGIMVAQLFPIKPASVDSFAEKAKESFARYRAAGARAAGVLVTLDVRNNFPQLPIRTDGPYLVWLGLVRDETAYNAQLKPALENAAHELAAGGMLRGAPELFVMDPTPRSRLRWR